MKKYSVLKQFDERKWEVGDIVLTDDRSAQELTEQGFIEMYEGEEPHKHIAITVDPVKLSTINNN